MDDPLEDTDIQLQRASSDLLLELETSLPSFCWSTSKPSDTHSRCQTRHLRVLVRGSTTRDLIKLLEPFQEWPQLLDPRLATLVPILLKAYLELLREQPRKRHVRQWQVSTSNFTIPLSQAISKLLYTLCKVRGAKVISRFFNNEPSCLEPILDAFPPRILVLSEDQNGPDSTAFWEASPRTPLPISLTWEEKYILLLWLSHLMLTPFDLASISSPKSLINNTIPTALEIPPGVPSIALRTLSICSENLTVAGKERETAVALLVRMALRPDMRKIGLLDALVQWALSSCTSQVSAFESIYTCIGILSFLAGVISLADAAVTRFFILPVFKCIQDINAQKTLMSKDIMSSALARKIIVKILRGITIIILQIDSLSSSVNLSINVDNILEEVIEYLLTALADKDTTVRFAASKALSVITAKLQADMATEIVQAIIDSLEENVIWEDLPLERTIFRSKSTSFSDYESLNRNLASVNALQWQGLTLTLSHLLFRRSPQPEQLPPILNALILALCFEQRTSTGNSIGTNVRDAACFGIWSLARRYTTKELLTVDISTVRAAKNRGNKVSVLQVLANQLVVAASIDPFGNIRRGASAALQELIGRHPDTIIQGITLVQVVDYHAVALRARAVMEVAIEAAKLSNLYWDDLMDGLIGWRGIAAPNSESRRLAAHAIGRLVPVRGWDGAGESTERVSRSLSRLNSRDVEQRHGLLLALRAILKESGVLLQSAVIERPIAFLSNIWEIFQSDSFLHEKDFTSSVSRPELTAEAACCLISALASSASGASNYITKPSPEVLMRVVRLVSISLGRTEEIVIGRACEAIEALFKILDDETKERLVLSWTSKLKAEVASLLRPTGSGIGHLAALGAIFSNYKHASSVKYDILDRLVEQSGPEMDIETRVATLKSLKEGVFICKVITLSITKVVSNGLDDYTTNQRGDVGSLVRVEAIDALHVAWQYDLLDERSKKQLISQVCGLAVEKLDKVRFRAWCCLSAIWKAFEIGTTPPTFVDVAATASINYYLQMLKLTTLEWVRIPLLRGFVTSAGTGSESVLRASRGALAAYSSNLDKTELEEIYEALTSILQTNTTTDRITVAVLEVIGFLLSVTASQILSGTQTRWEGLFLLVQKAHYKTTNVHKLMAAVEVYSGLASLRDIGPKATLKLVNMLLHPYPQIRNAAADALFILKKEDIVRQVDWSLSPKDLKMHVHRIQESIRRESQVT